MSSFGSRCFRRINFDTVAGASIAITGCIVLGEGYVRSELSDAQTSLECRYPPASSIITAEHVRKLEQSHMVVIHNVLSTQALAGARRSVHKLTLDAENHSNDDDVRQDQICLVRESDSDFEHDSGSDDIIHCIKLLRGIPCLLDRFNYNTSSFVVPRQCQLARYLPDGSTYKRHLDKCTSSLSDMGLLGWLRASDYRHRSVTCILYLNAQDWTSGGKLRCFDYQQEGKSSNSIDINPTGGTLIIFDSEKVEHEVLPSSNVRYALTIWINGTSNDST